VKNNPFSNFAFIVSVKNILMVKGIKSILSLPDHGSPSLKTINKL